MYDETIGTPDDLLTTGQVETLTGMDYRPLVFMGNRTGFAAGVKAIAWRKEGRSLLTTRREVSAFMARRARLDELYLTANQMVERMKLPQHLRTASDMRTRVLVGSQKVSVFGDTALPPGFKFKQLVGHRFYEGHVNRYSQIRQLVVDTPGAVSDILSDDIYWPEYEVPMHCPLAEGWSNETRLAMIEAQAAFASRSFNRT